MWARNPSRAAGGGCAAAVSAPSPCHPCFRSSSFKDVYSLLADDAPEPSPASPRASVLHRVRAATSALRAWRSLAATLPAAEEDKRVVIYFTSLRVVRKTFEDCRTVRSILRGLRVAVDERDVSMDSRLLDELKALLRRGEVRLPVVFIGGRCVGGADEVRQLHESGELRRRLEGAPPPPAAACEICAGIGFVLCQSCDGSRKCYREKGGGFRSCSACNENGLVWCAECRISPDGPDLVGREVLSFK